MGEAWDEAVAFLSLVGIEVDDIADQGSGLQGSGDPTPNVSQESETETKTSPMLRSSKGSSRYKGPKTGGELMSLRYAGWPRLNSRRVIENFSCK